MKPASLMVTLAAGLAAAQGPLDQIPTCAKDCVTKSLAGSGSGCSIGDIGCYCKSQDFLNNIACCLGGVCSKGDQDKTLDFAKKICTGAKVSVPDKVECTKKAAASGPSRKSSAAAAAPMVSRAGNMAGALLAIVAAL